MSPCRRLVERRVNAACTGGGYPTLLSPLEGGGYLTLLSPPEGGGYLTLLSSVGRRVPDSPLSSVGRRVPDSPLSSGGRRVENPCCLWGRIDRHSGSEAESPDQYDDLHVRMNLFYHDVNLDARQLKPPSLDEGQVCVVYWAVLRSWCRAVVQSVSLDSVSCQVRCLLVDHGEHLSIPSNEIRAAGQNFLQLPFRVRMFHLARIKPTTLQVSICENTAELIPSSRWDSSATLYLHKLVQASTQMEAVLYEAEAESTPIELFLTLENIKICVNDDLVAKKFAYYRQLVDGGGLDEVDRHPSMLASNVLTWRDTHLTSDTPTGQTLPAPVISERSLTAAGPADPMTSTSLPQRPQHDQETHDRGGAKITGGLQAPGNKSEPSPDSNRSEDTDSSLAAALTKNLSLFRFLKFLNPDSSPQQAVPCCSQWTSRTFRTSREMQQVEKFLEWLNPEPLNPDPDAADDTVVPSDPSRSGVLVHSALPVEPCTSLDDAPITDTLRRVLRRRGYGGPSLADSCCWQSVARGCDTLFISHSVDQPLTYLPPILTYLQLSSVFTSLTSSSTGPIAVVVCPGWEKVQTVSNLLEDRQIAQNLHPTSVLLGATKDEAKSVRIPKNCLLLVTTPFTLVRLLACHCFLFLRLYHLVLDEVDQLFDVAPDQMATILNHFEKVTSGEKKTSYTRQLVAVAKRWTSHMEGLLANHMSCPCVVITIPQEAALYGNVQQTILLSLENSKISVLLGALDFKPDVGQKTIIVTNSAEEVEDVFKAVSNTSAFCLKTHERITHQFDIVIHQWRKDVGRGTQVILVTNDTCLVSLGIRDATCVIHYGFPGSPRLFGSRLFCMSHNFRNLTDPDHTKNVPPPVRSVLLMSERNACHVIGILRYLRRTDAPLPPELLSFAQGVCLTREDQKSNRPLCSYLKSFGVCGSSSVCPDRHRFNAQLDQSLLPASGVIEVLPLYVKTASVFYGRIVRTGDDSFDSMAVEMSSYYADTRPGPQEVLEGGFYAVQEDQVFHRVKVLSVPDPGEQMFYSVLVQYVDEGREVEVKSQQLLHLPDRFQTLPSQAKEIIVCRVKPADKETDWNPKVTRAISKKIRGLQHRARVVLSLGNTIFVDPMVRVTHLPGMKTVINDYNVQSEILNSGMGTSNPQHLDLLKALCQGDVATGGLEANHISGSGDCTASPEVRVQAVDGVLAEAFSAAEVRRIAGVDPPRLQPQEPVGPASQPSQLPLPVPPAPELHQVPVCDQTNVEAETGEQRDHAAGPEPADQTASFHPQIRWYQSSDSLVLTVKLINPECQRCDFYQDRLVYSGRVRGRCYRAELELHANVAADRCRWEMKSNEPVVTLVKCQQGPWDRLLRNKNIFVSYDLDRVQVDEDTTSNSGNHDRMPNGLQFLEDTGEDSWLAGSESGSESD
ncbi:putative ATP-dependent RNA helicase TDRD12 [Diretmus argenteus]